MSQLQIALFGPPEIRHGGRMLTFATRKELALLLYLVVEERGLPRKHLRELFWPESEAPQARAALRVTLLRLREALAEGQEQHSQSHLLSIGDQLALDLQSGVWSDLYELETLWSIVAGEVHHITPARLASADPTLRERLEQGITLVRGPFLQDVAVREAPDFDDWLRSQRERWHLRLQALFHYLAQWQEVTGEIARAAETVRHQLLLNPLDEQATYQLLRLVYMQGDRTGTLKIYESFRARLADELHTQPTPEMLAFIARIRHTPLPRPAQQTRSSASSLATLVHGLPLVGRAHEFATLVAHFEQVRGKQAEVIVIEGEAGIGKTRLTGEFVTWAATQGADVLQGRAFEMGGHLAYQPLVKALRPRLEQENAPDDLLADVWLSELTRLFPELHERYPDLPSPSTDDTTTANRLFEAFNRLLQALAHRAPLVLLIDDIQWLDMASRDLLLYLSEAWAERRLPVLLLLCVRSEELTGQPALSTWLMAVGRMLPLTHISLNAFSAETTQQLLALLQHPTESAATSQDTPHPSLEPLGRWLYSRTAGQPFYVLEMLKVLLEQKILTSQRGMDGVYHLDCTHLPNLETLSRVEISSSVRELIHSRLARLSAHALRLLLAAAVLDQRSTFEMLYRVADLSEQEGLLALEEVLDSRIVHSEIRAGKNDNEPVYIFAHDLLRQGVYEKASLARQRMLHARALETLRTQAIPAAELALHAQASGLLQDSWHYNILAGDEALAVFAVHDAIVFYEQAMQFVREQQQRKRFGQEDILPSVEHLTLHLGRAYELMTAWQDAQHIYEFLLAYAKEMNMRTLACTALNRLALLAAQSSFDLNSARAYLQEAQRIAEEGGDMRTVAEIEWNLAQMAIHAWESTPAREHAARALELAQAAGSAELCARSLYIQGMALIYAGSHEQALPVSLHALAYYKNVQHQQELHETLPAQWVYLGSPPTQQLTNQAAEVMCLLLLLLGRVNSGQAHTGADAGREALQLSREIKNVWAQVLSAQNLNHALLEIGAYEEALSITREAFQSLQTTPNPTLRYFVLVVLAMAWQALMQLNEASTLLEEAWTLAQSFAVTSYQILVLPRLCTNAALSGDWERAAFYAKKAVMVRRNVEATCIMIDFFRHYEIEALLRAGEIDLVEEEVRLMGETIGANRRFRIPYERSLALLAAWKGETEQAILHVQNAVKLGTEMELPRERWQGLAALGEMLARAGLHEQARQAFAQAARIILEVAEKIRDDALRVHFLQAPPLQEIFRHSHP